MDVALRAGPRVRSSRTLRPASIAGAVCRNALTAFLTGLRRHPQARWPRPPQGRRVHLATQSHTLARMFGRFRMKRDAINSSHTSSGADVLVEHPTATYAELPNRLLTAA